MRRQFNQAGFLLSYLPLIAFWVGFISQVWLLTPILFFVVMPLARSVVGDLKPTTIRPTVSPFEMRFLNEIPRAYSILWSMSLVAIGLYLREMCGYLSILDWIGFCVSLWVVSSVNMTIVHELIHRSSKKDIRLGRVLALTSGHFYFIEEHYDHHIASQLTQSQDCAARTENVYSYVIRHMRGNFQGANNFEQSRLIRRNLWFWHNRILQNLLATGSLVLLAFYFIEPLAALAFLIIALGTVITVQVMTFIQHWGLDNPSLSWEDGCLIQSYVILKHALHQSHHNHPGLPFYYLTHNPAAPKLPSGYALLFMLAFFPKTFRTVMGQALDSYLANVQPATDNSVKKCYRV